MRLSPAEKQALVTRLQWYTSFRLVMAFFLCLVTWVIKPGADGYILGKSFFAIAGITALHLGAALVFFIVFRVATQSNVRRFSYVQIFWDTVFTTMLVYLTGGIESHFRFLYWLLIMNAGFLLFQTGAILAASLSAIFYSLLANLLYLQHVPMIFEKIWHPGEWQENQIIFSIVFNSVVFFIVAWVSTNLANNYRRSQVELAEKNIELEQMERKILESEQLAAVGELAARIAHEIRNPLTSVSGAIQMLSKESSFAPESQKLMNIAIRETDRLNLLLTEFLSFAKPITPLFGSISLSSLINETFESFSKSYGKNEIVFEMHERDKTFVSGDMKQLTQVFWNLFKNAAEAMNGKGKISVLLYQDAKGHTVAEIKDEGKGIPETVRGKIFQPFFTTKAKGTGLGLSIVHRIVQQHHGDIVVESEENKGSLFRITFVKGVLQHG